MFEAKKPVKSLRRQHFAGYLSTRFLLWPNFFSARKSGCKFRIFKVEAGRNFSMKAAGQRL